MNITVVGAGYVGLVTAICLSKLGNNVTCVDIDKQKILNLCQGRLPIYEPGLDVMLKEAIHEEKLHFVASIQEQKFFPIIIFIAVGTPEKADGSANMSSVLSVASDIGDFLEDYCVIVDKSTVPVGVADQVTEIIQNRLNSRDKNIVFDVVSNPEFLREGGAVEDFMYPDRVVVGLESEKARKIMQKLYDPILRHPEKIYFMSVREAEMTKYTANAMLATRISFMNEIAILCEKKGVDIEKVRLAIGADVRIGPRFLNAGCGYGGSCFPKDIKALIKMFENHNLDPIILKAVDERNVRQKNILFQKIFSRFNNNLINKKIAVWGLAFKPETDDMREAPSLILIEKLIESGAQVYAYDPVAMKNAKKIFPDSWLKTNKLILTENQYQAVFQVDALVLVTEWKSFSYPDLTKMAELMAEKIIFDGRNLFDPQECIKENFEYNSIGRVSSSKKEKIYEHV